MPLGTVWSSEEDQRLGELVKLHGPKKWSQIAADLNTNKGSKQCRRRWKNFLSLDDRKLGSWTAEEDAQLLECHKQHGNKWTLIAQEIGGRTDNAVKNRWAALEKKRKESDGYGQQRTYSRDSSDLLAVRRIISKDQPQRSYSGRQHSNLMDANWMQDSRNQSAAAAAFQQQQMQQLDHGAYTMQPAFGGRQPGSVSSGMPVGKPDLKINIPGGTAPELPYSQRPQATGADPSRLQKAGGYTPREMWLDPHEHCKVEDDALLSTSRQGAHAPMAGLATPSEEPGALQDLFKFLYSGTPGAAQLCAAAAAAAGQAGPAAPWKDPVTSIAPPQQQQQQYLPQAPQLLPASSAPYMGQQQQQQSMYIPGHMSAPQDAGAGYMQMQQPGRMVPPPGMHYSQPQLQQQPTHALSKLSRTVSGFDGPLHPASMPQPSLPDGMLLRQAPPPPQPRFVPQGPPPQSQGFVAMGGSMMSHNNTAVTTAAGGFQPASRPLEHMHGMAGMAGLEQQQHMMHRQQMPVLSQQQPPASHLLPQDPMLPPQSMQQQQQTMRPQHANMPGPQPPAFAPTSQPTSQWNADDVRQLLDILHHDGTGAQGQQQVLAHPQPLQSSGSCLTALHHVAVECKLEQANNVTGSLTAAT